jgi:hypothetical protein
MADEKKFDAFHPQEPKIPGVPENASRPPKAAPAPPKPLAPPPLPKRKVEEKQEHMPMMWVAGIVAACIVCVIVAWWSHHVSAKEEIAGGEAAVGAGSGCNNTETGESLVVGKVYFSKSHHLGASTGDGGAAAGRNSVGILAARTFRDM